MTTNHSGSPEDAYKGTDSPENAIDHSDSPENAINWSDSPKDEINHSDSPEDATNHSDSPKGEINHSDFPEDATNHSDSPDNESNLSDSPEDWPAMNHPHFTEDAIKISKFSRTGPQPTIQVLLRMQASVIITTLTKLTGLCYFHYYLLLWNVFDTSGRCQSWLRQCPSEFGQIEDKLAGLTA